MTGSICFTFSGTSPGTGPFKETWVELPPGKLSIHLECANKNFTPGEDGFLIITEKLITAEDRMKLLNDEITSNEFEAVLNERLPETGWQDYDFEVTLSDGAAE